MYLYLLSHSILQVHFAGPDVAKSAQQYFAKVKLWLSPCEPEYQRAQM